MGCADETTPHMNAHIGANHVIGFKSSRMTAGRGRVLTSSGSEIELIDGRLA
jgi:hypothetical protein